MVSGIVVRLLKAVLIGGLMYASVRYLGFSNDVAATLALIPLILGALGLLTGLAFSIVGLTFIVAAFSVIVHPKQGNAVEFTKSLVQDVSDSVLKSRAKVLAPSIDSTPITKSPG